MQTDSIKGSSVSLERHLCHLRGMLRLALTIFPLSLSQLFRGPYFLFVYVFASNWTQDWTEIGSGRFLTFSVSSHLAAEAFERSGCHAAANPPQLHRQSRLRSGSHGPVFHTQSNLRERLTRWLGECECSSEAHYGARGWRAQRGRAPQTGPDHLHSHVPVALLVGAAYCFLHQLPAPELFFRLHAIW